MCENKGNELILVCFVNDNLIMKSALIATDTCAHTHTIGLAGDLI